LNGCKQNKIDADGNSRAEFPEAGRSDAADGPDAQWHNQNVRLGFAEWTTCRCDDKSVATF